MKEMLSTYLEDLRKVNERIAILGRLIKGEKDLKISFQLTIRREYLIAERIEMQADIRCIGNHILIRNVASGEV